jgi:hypothetical protein
VARNRDLLRPHVSDAQVRAVTSAYRPGPFLYGLAVAAAFASVVAALAIVAGLALFFILPRRGAHSEA